MRLGIMQPYFFPYLGYFQLLHSVDTFVFYDDVAFINRGWINRNNIIYNCSKKMITIPLNGASQNKMINEIKINKQEKQYLNLLGNIKQSYRKAPHFDMIFELIRRVVNESVDDISTLAQNSIISVAEYIGLDRKFKVSSLDFPQTRGLEKADRLIEICHLENVKNCVNVIGGMEIYTKHYFQSKHVNLHFVKTEEVTYNQFGCDIFTPWLSIIDVLMFNEPERVIEIIEKYELI